MVHTSLPDIVLDVLSGGDNFLEIHWFGFGYSRVSLAFRSQSQIFIENFYTN